MTRQVDEERPPGPTNTVGSGNEDDPDGQNRRVKNPQPANQTTSGSFRRRIQPHSHAFRRRSYRRLSRRFRLSAVRRIRGIVASDLAKFDKLELGLKPSYQREIRPRFRRESIRAASVNYYLWPVRNLCCILIYGIGLASIATLPWMATSIDRFGLPNNLVWPEYLLISVIAALSSGLAYLIV